MAKKDAGRGTAQTGTWERSWVGSALYLLFAALAVYTALFSEGTLAAIPSSFDSGEDAVLRTLRTRYFVLRIASPVAAVLLLLGLLALSWMTRLWYATATLLLLTYVLRLVVEGRMHKGSMFSKAVLSLEDCGVPLLAALVLVMAVAMGPDVAAWTLPFYYRAEDGEGWLEAGQSLVRQQMLGF